ARPRVRAGLQHEGARQRAGPLDGARHRDPARGSAHAGEHAGPGNESTAPSAGGDTGRGHGTRDRSHMSTPLELLVVDDDERIRERLSGFLRDEDHRPSTAASAEDALRMLQQGRRFDAILLDVKMPGMSGLVALMRIAELDPNVVVVVVSGEDTITAAREAIIKLGAFD